MNKPIPVPEEQRSHHGPGSDPATSAEGTEKPDAATADQSSYEDPDQQGEQANIRQNTTHQGYQQDR